MRYRIQYRPSLFADKLRCEYVDAHAVMCVTHHDVIRKKFDDKAQAVSFARKLNNEYRYGGCAYDIAYVVGHAAIPSDLFDSAVVYWVPGVDGTPTKSAMELVDFERMFTRVEE